MWRHTSDGSFYQLTSFSPRVEPASWQNRNLGQFTPLTNPPGLARPTPNQTRPDEQPHPNKRCASVASSQSSSPSSSSTPPAGTAAPVVCDYDRPTDRQPATDCVNACENIQNYSYTAPVAASCSRNGTVALHPPHPYCFL